MWTAKTVKRPPQQPTQPQDANYWAPLTRKRHILPHPAQPQRTSHWTPRTRKRHQQEHRPQRPTESDPTQHAKGRTGVQGSERNQMECHTGGGRGGSIPANRQPRTGTDLSGFRTPMAAQWATLLWQVTVMDLETRGRSRRSTYSASLKVHNSYGLRFPQTYSRGAGADPVIATVAQPGERGGGGSWNVSRPFGKPCQSPNSERLSETRQLRVFFFDRWRVRSGEMQSARAERKCRKVSRITGDTTEGSSIAHR